MRLLPLALGMLPVLFCRQALAAPKSVTYFLDGAKVEQELPADKGYLELALPDNFTPGSLRVKAIGGGALVRVELVPAEQDRRRSAELARLKERQGELQDRMAVLQRREEIFGAAARSQSAKSPRRTKTNPDPLSSLQRGTQFALNQMESVYAGKRRCQKALDEVERSLARASKGVASARVWVTGSRVRVSYLLQEERWAPGYDLRVPVEGVGELLLHAKLPKREKGVQYLVSRGTVAQAATGEAVRGDYPTLSRYPLHLLPGSRQGQPPTRLIFKAVEADLPPGEAALYWQGEYLGSAPFSGGGATEFSLAR